MSISFLSLKPIRSPLEPVLAEPDARVALPAPVGVAVLAACCSTAVAAQPLPAPVPVAASSPVLITGNPLGRSEPTQPASVLSGDGLTLRRAGSLGDTLDGLPGVAATGFAPGSSRPVIRGLDGDRIRILEGGGASVDASSLSFDHASAADPLAIERIEVLRGPAALLYGGNAVGGVVNLIDNRIPRAPLGALSGRTEWRVGGASREGAGSILLEAGNASDRDPGAPALNWHLDAGWREGRDLRVPSFSPPGTDEPRRSVENSAAATRTAALGVSLADARGYLGAAIDAYRSHYGVVVEPEVTIRMRRERLQVAGERTGLSGPLRQVEFQAAVTEYEHRELEGAEVGTVFRSRGLSLRTQARHAPWGPGFEGVVGLQAESLDFSALGEEAFVPSTTTRTVGVFTLQTWRTGPWSLAAGLRQERVTVGSAGDEVGAEDARFGPPSDRRFSPRSATVQGAWALAAGWNLRASAGATQRAPAYYELFANGLHVATGAFEVGQPDLQVERSRHRELALAWRGGPHRFEMSAYRTQVPNYIALRDSGFTDEEGNPVYRFGAVPARLTGYELEGVWQVVGEQAAVRSGAWTVELSGTVDAVGALDEAQNEPLPRIAPRRWALGAQASRGDWQFSLRWRDVQARRSVPADDEPTAGYRMLDALLQWRQRWAGGAGGTEALWFLRAANVGNQLAFNAVALPVARSLAPLPGRSLTAGVRVQF